MIGHNDNKWSDAQTLVAAVGNVEATNVLDTGATGTTVRYGNLRKDLGRGGRVKINAQIVTAVDSAGGAATLKVQILGSAAENMGSPVVLAESEAIPEAELVVGYRFRIPDSFPVKSAYRYFRPRYVIAGEDITAGAIDCEIVEDLQTGGLALA